MIGEVNTFRSLLLSTSCIIMRIMITLFKLVELHQLLVEPAYLSDSFSLDSINLYVSRALGSLLDPYQMGVRVSLRSLGRLVKLLLPVIEGLHNLAHQL